MLPHDKVYSRIKPSPLHGIGVFAIKGIPKGTYVFQDENEEMVWISKEGLSHNRGLILGVARGTFQVKR